MLLLLQSWEYGLPLCEKLAEVYKEKILYEKLSQILVSILQLLNKFGSLKCKYGVDYWFTVIDLIYLHF